MESIENRIIAMLDPLLEGSDMFLTSVRIKPTNNIKVFLDADSGLNVAKSAEVNRKLYHLIEESAMFPDGDYSLEVSSPGIEEPLGSLRQYKKNIGRTVEVTPLVGDAVTGILKEVTEEKVVLGVKGTKKLPPQDIDMPLNFIKTAIVQVVF
jgi:ribosome maturation factor RimP